MWFLFVGRPDQIVSALNNFLAPLYYRFTNFKTSITNIFLYTTFLLLFVVRFVCDQDCLISVVFLYVLVSEDIY